MFLRRGRKRWMRCIVIPVMLSLIILVGCAGSQKGMPIKPTKPTLEVISRPDGGICLDRRNTEKLMRYILELEYGYEQ